MPTISKILIGLVFVILIAAGIWWFYSSQNPAPATQAPVVSDQAEQQQPAPQPSAPAQPAVDTGKNSDASLNNDLNAIDNQTKNLGTDANAVDSSLNAQ